MLDGANVIYIYDGSFDGLMTALFTAFERKVTPLGITDEYSGLIPTEIIETDDAKAERIKRGILTKVGEYTLYCVKMTYLSDDADRELHILGYLRRAFEKGGRVNGLATDDDVIYVVKTARRVSGEAHKFKMFARFSESGGILTAKIKPTCKVLPLIAAHFCDRYPNEKFLIYDQAHSMALIYADGKAVIEPMSEFDETAVSEEEMRYRRLYKLFYDTIEIKSRHNERCRMTHMPKRYWENLTELSADNAAHAYLT